MKCPHCEYEHGWSAEQLDVIEGKEGHFFQMSNNIVATRPGQCGHYQKTCTVYACPSCRKVFIGD